MAPIIASLGKFKLEIFFPAMAERASTINSITSASSISLNTEIAPPLRRYLSVAPTVISRGLIVISMPIESKMGRYSGSFVMTRARLEPYFFASRAARILFSSSSESAMKKSASFILMSLNRFRSVPVPWCTRVLESISAASVAASRDGSMIHTSLMISSRAFARLIERRLAPKMTIFLTSSTVLFSMGKRNGRKALFTSV